MEIMHTITKKINNNSIAVVKFGIADSCGNGYNNFECHANIWATNGDRAYGSIKYYKNKNYYFLKDVFDKEFIGIFPELKNVWAVRSRDIFGCDNYPIMNGKYHLKNDINYAAKHFIVSISEAKKIAKFNDLLLSEYVQKLIEGKYKKMTVAAIKEIEFLSGKKYVQEELLSPRLYNDLHYLFITKKEGWNVYKTLDKAKINKYPHNFKTSS